MKYVAQFFFCTFLIFSYVSATAGAELPTENVNTFSPVKGWEKLGSRKVNYGLDRDEIIVTARDGRFTKVKIKVRNGGLNMHKVVVHFGNGETQKVALKNNFRRGSESRVVDLNGGKRVIKKVVFWYDSKNVSRRKAKLELWGR